MLLIIIAALTGMIAFGTGILPVPLASISNAFENVDFSDLPAAQTISRRGRSIAFRVWAANPHPAHEVAVIAIHGSCATSHSLHPLASALSAEGISITVYAYAPDIRVRVRARYPWPWRYGPARRYRLRSPTRR